MTTVEGLTEDAHKTAVEAAVDLIREKHPDLDVRAGTAVRSLVVEPAALLAAMQRDTVSRLRTAMSLKAMSRETTVPRDDAEAVLSNFGITLGGGTKATGLVRVNVIGTTQLTIRAGVVFSDAAGASFVVTKTTTAAVDPADGESEIRSSGDGLYYFTVPVEAVEVGTSGNIVQNHALTPSVIIGNYSSASAFSDFSGGTDGETVAAAVARIPAALAYRGMTNALSVRATLSAAMSDPSALRAVSCVGYGRREQLRDRHNPFGISVGGRVDVYARLFDAPGVVSFVATGVLEDAATRKYAISIPDYPGFYAVRYVGPADQPSRQGSLQYELVRGAKDAASDAHDFVTIGSDGKDTGETAWSAYQTGKILVYSDSAQSYPLSGETAESVQAPAATEDFKVDLYWTDGIASLQNIVDADDVRNVAADYVVRSPAICLVSLTAAVRLKPGVSVSASVLEEKIAEYVNGRSFVRRLTRSEIANVMLQNGVVSVDMGPGGMYLGGRICGADGVWRYLEGDSLDVDSVDSGNAMIGSGTVVFAAEPGSIQVTVLA